VGRRTTIWPPRRRSSMKASAASRGVCGLDWAAPIPPAVDATSTDWRTMLGQSRQPAPALAREWRKRETKPMNTETICTAVSERISECGCSSILFFRFSLIQNYSALLQIAPAVPRRRSQPNLECHKLTHSVAIQTAASPHAHPLARGGPTIDTFLSHLILTPKLYHGGRGAVCHRIRVG
jgi:hypothetical protein